MEQWVERGGHQCVCRFRQSPNRIYEFLGTVLCDVVIEVAIHKVASIIKEPTWVKGSGSNKAC